MRSLRTIAALVLVAATFAVLETRSFTALERVRLKLIQIPTAPVEGTARIAFSGSPALAGTHPPLALIARIRNADSTPLNVTIGVDDREICRSVVAGNATMRVDCVVEEWSSAANHSLAVTGGRTSWQVEALEIATHFGNTTGLNYLVILPRDAASYEPPARWLVVVIGAVLLVVLLLPTATWPRGWRVAHRVVSGVIVVVALALVIAPWLSQYRVVVSVPTVVFWLSLLCLPQLWAGGTWLTRARPMPSRLAMLRVVGVGCLATIPFLVVVRDLLLNTYDHNYSGFVKISKQQFDINPVVRNDPALRSQLILLDGGGYDGQFAYFIAFDPLMRRFREAPAQYRDMVDGVPYRFGRVGFSVITRGMSLGNPSRFPQVMVWLTLVGIFGLACVLAAFAQSLGRSPAYGALVVLVPGFWQSVQTALPEPLAAATLAAGAVLLTRHRIVPAALLFAASLVIRETGLALVLFCAAALFARGDRRLALVCLVVAIAPAVLWRLYVAWTMYPAQGLRALNDYPGDLGVPLRGIVDMWKAVATGEYAGGSSVVARAGISFSVLACTGLALAVCLAVARPSVFTAAAVVYGLIAVALDYQMIWVHVGNAQRGTYELFVLLALSAVTVRVRPLWLRWSQRLFWVASAAYVFFGAAEAEALRAALLLN